MKSELKKCIEILYKGGCGKNYTCIKSNRLCNYEAFYLYSKYSKYNGIPACFADKENYFSKSYYEKYLFMRLNND